MKKVGFIGLGIMGCPMTTNLIKGGCQVLAYDVSEAATRRAAELGAVSASLARIGEECSVIFLSLPNGDIVKNVLFGEAGLAKHLKKGAIVADTSSVTPVQSQYCSDRLAQIGVEFVDCPVSGGEPGAINGTLAFMAGGKQEIFDALMPYYDMMGSSAVLIGGTGSGSVTKLANQAIVNLTIAAVSEAFVLSSKCGADPEKVFAAIRGGLAGSAVLESKAPMMIARNFKPGGAIAINHKDIKNVLSTAHEVDVPMPLTSQLFEIMQALKVSGHLGDDHSGIVQYYEQLAGVIVKKMDA